MAGAGCHVKICSAAAAGLIGFAPAESIDAAGRQKVRSRFGIFFVRIAEPDTPRRSIILKTARAVLNSMPGTESCSFPNLVARAEKIPREEFKILYFPGIHRSFTVRCRWLGQRPSGNILGHCPSHPG